MKKILALLIMIPFFVIGQEKKKDSKFKEEIKKVFKFSTFYAAANGGNSVSDVDVFSVTNGLETEVVQTPFDYSLTFGVRKIARLGYENRANTFYNGTENSFSDAATIGKIKGFEFLFEVDYTRQQGIELFNQQHFLRYVANRYIIKVEYLQDGFADIKYFEASQRYRQKIGKKLSLNIGAVQRLSEPYGYDPLEEWMLSNGNLHYTQLAIEEGYSISFSPEGITYLDPSGNVVAENTEVWEAVAIPQVLSDYTERKRNELDQALQHSIVIGFDYYHYDKRFWLHSWGNLMPYHYDNGGEFSFHKFNDGQWLDYSGGLIFGYYIVPKKLGVFVEGKYNKYWNRRWHDFSLGFNYVIR